MFHHYGLGSWIATAIIVGILKLFKMPKRTLAPAKDVKPYVDDVRKVVAKYADCTAEVVNVFVSGRKKVALMHVLTPGDRVELGLHDGLSALFVKGEYMTTLLLPDNSRIPNLLKNDVDINAFLGGRDVTASSVDAEFCSVIAFYKIEGVPPTVVNIN